MNKFKKRLLSCLLCAMGGLNLNAKALNSTPEQKKSETSVAGRSNGGSREGSLLSFRTLAEALLLGYFSYDKYQNYKKNKKFGDMNTILNDKKGGLDPKENELKQKEDALKQLNKNLQKQMSEISKRDKDLKGREKQLKLEQKKLDDKSKETVLGGYAVYNFLYSIALKKIGEAGIFSKWRSFDKNKQELKYAKFGENAFVVHGYIGIDKDTEEEFMESGRTDFGNLVDDLDVRNLSSISVESKLFEYIYPECIETDFYGNENGKREIFTKYIQMKGQPSCIVAHFYYAKENEYRWKYNLDKVFVVFTIGYVTDKK